jgi:threonine dehydratase
MTSGPIAALAPGAIRLADVEAARRRLSSAVLRTPLVRLDVEGLAEVWLKLENLQPIGSFKIRGAGNAILAAPPAGLQQGIVTASAGNMAQGVAWWARRLGVPATAVVPEHAPAAKTTAIERLGGRVIRIPFDRWWRMIAGEEIPDLPGVFVHPVADPLVVAGNGTMALEILEDLPDVETVLVPYGGGGMACGLAVALAEARPGARVIGCEVETATPLTASLAAGQPEVVPYTASFVEGIGGKSLLPAMWPLVRLLLAGSATATLDGIADAIRLLVARHRVVSEGAGAASVAAALAGHARGPTVCVVSGGNIDLAVLAAILEGRTPR